MDRFIQTMKFALGGIVTAISGFLGGMDGVMYALIGFITIDYITGVAVAVKQKKISSEVGFWGLVRKVLILVLVGVGHYIDAYIIGSGDVFRAAVALYYIGNEGISLLENCGNLGLPLPKKLIDIMVQIKNESEDDENGKDK